MTNLSILKFNYLSHVLPLCARRSIHMTLILLILFTDESHAADFAAELKEFEGYLVVGSEEIDDFDGCELGEIIQFESMEYVICREYGYQYTYRPDIVILANPIRTVGSFRCVMLVEDTFYSIDCDQYINNIINPLRTMLSSLDDDSSQELRQYILNQLRILGVQD